MMIPPPARPRTSDELYDRADEWEAWWRALLTREGTIPPSEAQKVLAGAQLTELFRAAGAVSAHLEAIRVNLDLGL